MELTAEVSFVRLMQDLFRLSELDQSRCRLHLDPLKSILSPEACYPDQQETVQDDVESLIELSHAYHRLQMSQNAMRTPLRQAAARDSNIVSQHDPMRPYKAQETSQKLAETLD